MTALSIYDVAEFSDLSSLLTCDDFVNENENNFVDGLCVPQDRLEDLEFFPNFTDDLIRLNGVLRAPEHEVESKQQKPEGSSEDSRGFLASPEQETYQKETESKQEIATKTKQYLDEGFTEVTDVKNETLISDNFTREEEEKISFSKAKSNIDIDIGGASKVLSVPKRQRSHNNLKRNSRSKPMFLPFTSQDENHNIYSPQDENQKFLLPKEENQKLPFQPRDGNKNATMFLSDDVNRRPICSHCNAVKTPQWREGPMGPKTLCNACGIKYKSGKLVAEYRPAASPSFDSRKHSNFHRKIVQMMKSSSSCEDDPGEVVNG